MGIWRQNVRLPLLCLAGMLLTLRPAVAQEALLFPAVTLDPGEEPLAAPVTWFNTRISPARWYGSADALMLMRDSTPNRPFATLNTPGNYVLGTGDLESNFQAGPRVTLGRRMGENFQFEVGWFDLGSWSDRAAVRDETANAQGSVGNLFSPFTTFGDPALPLLDYNNLAEIEYRSSLDNLEFNLRQKVIMPPGPFNASVMVGARHLEVRERFGYRTGSVTPLGTISSQDVRVTAGNDLWGVQIGALLEFQVEYRCQITLDLKGGIFNNAADQGTIYTATAQGVPVTTTGARAEDVTAWAGEIILAFNFQLTPRLSTQLGYQMLWIEGLALGSENFEADPTILALGPTNLNHDGHAIYHGPHIGVVLRL